ncbi:hypothetical protein ACFXKW_26355 [Streptomyces sp. NPDC059193]|uniref:hypothetical protein n=1 Tax=Streptomyces sp. NPDC059193 TaxID=3346763 RepID=UPI0036A8523D
MDLFVDHSVTSPGPGGNEWRIILTLTPGTASGRLDWHPEGLAEPEAFMITLGRNPLTERQIGRIRKTVARFPDWDVIDRAVWTYLHEQSRWDFEPAGDDDLYGAIEELTYLLQESVD